MANGGEDNAAVPQKETIEVPETPMPPVVNKATLLQFLQTRFEIPDNEKERRKRIIRTGCSNTEKKI